ncbi:MULTISPECIES: hypothetical protein [Thiorhodovibrio]|uniref:hypothetical protein n=1 Tax=Thiorhodovibrio TaxID=61593 RepID=UPI001914A5A4|nr:MULTISPECIES: hypothetical protein [Thiorhodovibrio]MBK5970482.1 hypothetical protein [Thiorhodovibrio winogradskyi]WPL11483.1 hypothetical protein Thiosp_01218 [Thiorhodovibrio litoralis]
MLQPQDRAAAHHLLDQLLQEGHGFDPFEFLLAAGWLRFADYEAWRLGRQPELFCLLRVEPKAKATELAALLAELHSYARAQGLIGLPQPLERWGPEPTLLKVGGGATEPPLDALLGTRLEPDPARKQLDLFHDSGATLLEERLRAALRARRPQAANEALAQLREQRPTHPQLAGWQQLIDAPATLAAMPDASVRFHALDAIVPIARHLLGTGARDYLAPLWTALAEDLMAAGGSDNLLANPAHHPAMAWSRAEHWQQARTAIDSTPDWNSHFELARLHARACWQDGDPHTARRDWLWQCWEHPDETARLLLAKDFPDPALTSAWQRFEDSDAEFDSEDFPAWLLLTSPGLVPSDPDFSPADENLADIFAAARALQAEPDQIARREALDAHHAGLLRAFLDTRNRSQSPRP